MNFLPWIKQGFKLALWAAEHIDIEPRKKTNKSLNIYTPSAKMRLKIMQRKDEEYGRRSKTNT
jgi:hypothetical protein